uniref:Uncharacterized protein n=2 Tax=Picea TaxID=3328 RepID=A0A101M0R4_PICGL|nr:hypothetical protein ABT39_MTgene4158 [Picea glauca]QHR90367.1 hypothetical protein Q903MT_gene4390 [Picea sitchensis]
MSICDSSVYDSSIIELIYIYKFLYMTPDSGNKNRVIQEFPNSLTELISALKAISPNTLNKLEE